MLLLLALLLLACSQPLCAGTVALAWDDAQTGVSGWRVYRSLDGGPYTMATATTTKSATVPTVDTVTNRFYVTAYNNAGESPPSNVVLVKPTVAPPALGLSFEAEAGVITAPFFVSGGWIEQSVQTDVASGGRASYVFSVTNAGTYTVSMLVNARNAASDSVFVNIDQEPIDTANTWHIPLTTGFETMVVNWNFATNATPFGLSAGQHTLIIRGREAGVQIDRITITPVTVTPPPAQPPLPPTNLRANAVTVSRIDVSWTLAAPEIVMLERSRDNLLWSDLATVAPGNSYYIDGGLQRGKVYYYRARTFNSVGLSTFSNVAFDRTLKH